MPLNLIPYLYKLHNLIKNQWINYSELKKLQDEKLRLLVKHAYYKIDYYRRIFDKAKINPKDIKTIQDLVKIPITTRKELQALPKKEIIAKDIDLSRCLKLRTSGSTGTPLDIFLSTGEKMCKSLSYRRMYFENGGKLINRTIIITNPQNFCVKRWFQRLGIVTEKYISVFDKVEKQIRVILEFAPQIIYGYASYLKNLSTKVKEGKIKNIEPRIIFSTADLLTKRDREFITSVFNSKIIDYYSCNECGLIAWECSEHSGYHIDSDNIIVEFIKEDGTKAKYGEEGEIVITSLNSYTMPFIRYKLGDIGVPSDERCHCGRVFPLIKSFVGRSSDYFILPNGKVIYSFSLRRALEYVLGISQYQIIQQEKNKIRINLVKNKYFSLDTLIRVKENCKFIFGNDVEVNIDIVNDIGNNYSGKCQSIKSELNLQV